MYSDQTMRLLHAIYTRGLEASTSLLDEYESICERLAAGDPGAPQIFCEISHAVEHSPRLAAAVRRLASEYSDAPWPHLSLLEWSWIQLGLARLAYFECRHADAENACQWIYENAFRAGAPGILLASNDLVFAQTLKRCSKYNEALQPVAAAAARFDAEGLPRMVAVCQVLEGWLLLQKGQARRANQLWTQALSFFEDNQIQDSYILGNLRFFRARSLARNNRDDESLHAYELAVKTHLQAGTPHRNVRRVLLAKADQEMRMARQDSKRAAELFQAARQDIDNAAQRLANDSRDIRNLARLLLARANFALHGPNPSLKSARLFAKTAIEFAVTHNDPLMIARALLRQAVIEERASWMEDEPLRKRCQACIYVRQALFYAIPLQNSRLTARCHLLLGKLYLEEPFCDINAAESEWKSAERLIEEHEGSDYLHQDIQALGRRVAGASSQISTGVIFTITARALRTGLEETVQEVERAIVNAAVERFGPNAAALCRLLGAGNERINCGLSAPRPRSVALSLLDGGEPLFSVTTSLAFGGRLEDTIHVVEREIIAAAYRSYKGNRHKVRRVLKIGYERFKRAMDEIEASVN